MLSGTLIKNNANIKLLPIKECKKCNEVFPVLAQNTRKLKSGYGIVIFEKF